MYTKRIVDYKQTNAGTMYRLDVQLRRQGNFTVVFIFLNSELSKTYYTHYTKCIPTTIHYTNGSNILTKM